MRHVLESTALIAAMPPSNGTIQAESKRSFSVLHVTESRGQVKDGVSASPLARVRSKSRN